MSGPATWGARAVLAPTLAVLMALPLSLTVGDLDLANAVVQAVAVLSVLLVLPAQVLLDARVRRAGAGIRLAILGLASASIFAFGWAAVQRGFSASALLSLLNWIALGGLVVTGQLLFADQRRLSWAMAAWATVQATVALGAAVYLLAEFGGELFLATSRAPFQAAVHEVITGWPNSAGMAFAVAACIAFGQLRAGAGGKWWIILGLLTLGVLVTFSRNAWLSLVVGVTAMALSGTRLIRSIPFAVRDHRRWVPDSSRPLPGGGHVDTWVERADEYYPAAGIRRGGGAYLAREPAGRHRLWSLRGPRERRSPVGRQHRALRLRAG